jgi:hypothetical protein
MHRGDGRAAGKRHAERFGDRRHGRTRLDGVLAKVVRLMYLGDKPGFIEDTPTLRRIEAFEADVIDLWRRIQTAYDRNEWPAKPSPLCGWCPLFNDCDDAQLPSERSRKKLAKQGKILTK